MKNKLTLKLDAEAIEAAKQYAKEHHTNVSTLVENYFLSLKPEKKKKYEAEELAGCLKDLRHLTNHEIKDSYVKEKHRVI